MGLPSTPISLQPKLRSRSLEIISKFQEVTRLEDEADKLETQARIDTYNLALGYGFVPGVTIIHREDGREAVMSTCNRESGRIYARWFHETGQCLTANNRRCSTIALHELKLSEDGETWYLEFEKWALKATLTT